ncbi:MAG: hypothetical protein WCT05_11385 [Lentisphaeria bacterium]
MTNSNLTTKYGAKAAKSSDNQPGQQIKASSGCIDAGKIIALFVAGILCCLNTIAQRTTAPDFQISEYWKPKKILSRDFWLVGDKIYSTKQPTKINLLLWGCINAAEVYFPSANLPEGMRKLAENPAFTDVALQYVLDAEDHADGTSTLSFPDVAKDPRLSARPFLIYAVNVTNAPLMSAVNSDMTASQLATQYSERFLMAARRQYRRVFFAPFRPSELPDFRKTHDNFIGFISCSEWFNEAFQYVTNARFQTAQVSKAINAVEAAQIRENYKVDDPSFPTRMERAKKIFDRAAKILEGPENMLVFDGVACVGHLAAYYGAGIIGCETSRTWRYWENQMICERGAARQFQVPWIWYIASWANGYTTDGQYTSEPYDARVPERRLSGSSHSLIDRVFYYAWLSGANLIEREGMYMNWFLSETTMELSPQGQNYVRFYEFTRRHPDRGTPYTPIALLRPAMTPSSRENRLFSNTAGAAMDNAFRATIYHLYPDEQMQTEVPGFRYELLDSYSANPHDGVRKAGYEMSLANTAPYGDLFDALTPDFPDPSSFTRILPAYKVAILLGEYEKNPAMAKILMDYVREGGMLVINTRQLSPEYPSGFSGIELTGDVVRSGEYLFDEVKPTGCEVLAQDGNGNILFTRHQYGKGAVIVTAPQFMIPETQDWQVQAVDANTGKLKFPLIDQLLQMLCSEVCPVRVEGDIKFGLNKTGKGWWLYLFNNKGVMKLDGKEEWFDMKRTANVTIDFKQLKVRSAVELCSGKTMSIGNNVLVLQVLPGDFKIIQLR